MVSELRGDLCIVSNALAKISEQDETVDVEGLTTLLQKGIGIESGHSQGGNATNGVLTKVDNAENVTNNN